MSHTIAPPRLFFVSKQRPLKKDGKTTALCFNDGKDRNQKIHPIEEVKAFNNRLFTILVVAALVIVAALTVRMALDLSALAANSGAATEYGSVITGACDTLPTKSEQARCLRAR